MKNWQLFHELKSDPSFHPKQPTRMDYPYGDGINEEEELPKHLKRAKEVANLNRNKLRAIHVAQSHEAPFRQGLQDRNPMAASQASIEERRRQQSKSPDMRGYPDQQASQQQGQEAAMKELREWEEFQDYKARKRDYEAVHQHTGQAAQYRPTDSQQQAQVSRDGFAADRYQPDVRQNSHQLVGNANGAFEQYADQHEWQHQQPAGPMHRQQPSSPKNYDFTPEEIDQMRQKIIEQEIERLAREEQAAQQPATPGQRTNIEPYPQPPRRLPDHPVAAQQSVEHKPRDQSLDKNKSEHLKKLNDFYGEFISEQHKRRQVFTKDDYNYLMSVKHMKKNGIL